MRSIQKTTAWGALAMAVLLALPHAAACGEEYESYEDCPGQKVEGENDTKARWNGGPTAEEGGYRYCCYEDTNSGEERCDRWDHYCRADQDREGCTEQQQATCYQDKDGDWYDAETHEPCGRSEGKKPPYAQDPEDPPQDPDDPPEEDCDGNVAPSGTAVLFAHHAADDEALDPAHDRGLTWKGTPPAGWDHSFAWTGNAAAADNGRVVFGGKPTTVRSAEASSGYTYRPGVAVDGSGLVERTVWVPGIGIDYDSWSLDDTIDHLGLGFNAQFVETVEHTVRSEKSLRLTSDAEGCAGDTRETRDGGVVLGETVDTGTPPKRRVAVYAVDARDDALDPDDLGSVHVGIIDLPPRP